MFICLNEKSSCLIVLIPKKQKKNKVITEHFIKIFFFKLQFFINWNANFVYDNGDNIFTLLVYFVNIILF